MGRLAHEPRGDAPERPAHGERACRGADHGRHVHAALRHRPGRRDVVQRRRHADAVAPARRRRRRTRRVSAAALAALIAGLTLVSGSDAALSAPIKWSAFADLARPRAFAQAVALPTGEILVVGGLDRADADVTNPKTELLDPVAHNV